MAHASRGTREVEGSAEPIEDPGLASQLAAKARSIHLKSLGLALVLTALAMLIPVAR